MANIPQPPEEEDKETEEAQQSDDKEKAEEKNGPEGAGELKEQGSPIVNEVEEMEADENTL